MVDHVSSEDDRMKASVILPQTLTLEILSPRAGALVVIGQSLNVGGTIFGKGGAEPVGVDSLMIQVGASPPVEAAVTQIPHVSIPTFTFQATVQVSGPPGPLTIVATVHFDNQTSRQQARSVTATTGELTGLWLGGDGTQYFVKQNVNSVWWVGMDSTLCVHGPGVSTTHVFRGEFQSDMGIRGSWADVPRAIRASSGTLALVPSQQLNGQVHELQVVASTGGFTTTKLTRVLTSPEHIQDIQTVLGQVQKNVDGASLGDNLKAYKDHVVVFGTLVPQDGQSVLVNWSVNADRTYRGFICAGADGEHDADANIDIMLDRTKLDSGGDFDQPGFWTDGWEPGVNPQEIRGRLDHQHNRLHLEMVMFGRMAKCGQPNHFDDPPLVPGWQELDGNSVLVNGRPLNGLPLDPITGLDGVPTRVVVLNNKPLVGFTLRVTGPLVLDVGHSIGDDTQEIHPVYAIDVIDATPLDNLSGVWGDNLGNTYYVRHLGNTVWWFGMGPVRDKSFGQVFQGTLTNGIVDGAWQDVPFGDGDAAGGLRLRLDPGKLRLVPDAEGPFADRRWLKLYDS